VSRWFYEIGDTGPGGGLIFLISDDLRYEMAPKTWGAAGDDTRVRWCSDAVNSVTTGLTVGGGSANTNAMLINAAPFVACTTSAPNVARGYFGAGGTNDWFLPSRDELNAMCNYSRNPTTPAAPNVVCGTNASPTTQDAAFAAGAFGFAAADLYWSSSQFGAAGAWLQIFGNGDRGIVNKTDIRTVRPVRAF